MPELHAEEGTCEVLHLISCRPVGLRATASEAAELARLLERGENRCLYEGIMAPVGIEPMSREAAICAEALRRTYGEPTL